MIILAKDIEVASNLDVALAIIFVLLWAASAASAERQSGHEAKSCSFSNEH